MMVALAFSGGGTRAAAFSFGVLQALGKPPSRARRRGALHRPYRLRHRRVRRLDHGRLFRTEEARRTRRFPRALPDPGRRGGAAHPRQPRQPVARDRRRGERGHPLPRLARRQPVRGRDLLGAAQRAPAAHLDQCHRHLQPHPLRVRQDRVQRDLQRPRPIRSPSAVAASAAVPLVVRADHSRNLPGRLRCAAAGLDQTRARQSEGAADACGVRARRRRATATARSNTSSCSTAALSTISGSPASPSGANPPRCLTARSRTRRP